jgi:hypothetical protein
MSGQAQTQVMGLSKIPFDRIELEGVGNPREDCDHVEELRASIARDGLKVPLRVWHQRLGGGQAVKVGGEKTFVRYLLVSGFRRHAAIAAQRKRDKHFMDEVPVVLIHGTEAEIRLDQLVETIMHEDWNPMEVADAVIALTAESKLLDGRAPVPALCPMAKVAESTGLTPTWLAQLVKVREKCCAAVVNAVRAGRVPVTEAAKWAGFDAAKQAERLREYLKTKAERGTRAANREARERDADDSPERVVKPTPKEIAETRSAMSILSSEPEWKRAMDALDWVAGRNRSFKGSVAKAVDAVRKRGGRDEGKGSDDKGTSL